MGSIAKNLTLQDSTSLADDLKNRLKQFDSPPELISVIVTTLSNLCNNQGLSKNESQKISDGWWEEILKSCDLYLSTVILNENQDEAIDEMRIIRHLFTLGEIAQMCPAKTPKRVFMLVQSLIAGSCITSIEGNTQAAQPIWQQTQYTQTQLSQGGHTQPLTQFSSSNMSCTVRAHAFITLGKLCLQNENIAKKCIAAMARELETCPDAPIRNNVVIIMCDLCIRYTSLVDRYVPNIAACLKDESPPIRKQTLTLITRLLQEDFLKWKGPLFFRFIVTIVDPQQDIKEFAEFCLIDLLLHRHPAMFFNNFVESIFHFNAYNSHNLYNHFPQTDREKTLFSLKGKDKLPKRMYIYKFMLEHMLDEHRFNLVYKLCQEILAGVVDTVMPLDSETSVLLTDTLAVLSSKEIKLASMKTKTNEDIGDEMEMATAVVEKAKKNFLTQVIKQHAVENIIPIVISLKHLLEKHRSPVIKDLMLYLHEMMKDYKNEIKEILAADKQLASEIEFDMRRFEEQKNSSSDEGGIDGNAIVPTVESLTIPAAGGGTPPGGEQGGAPVLNLINTINVSNTPGSRRSSLVAMAIMNTMKQTAAGRTEKAQKRPSILITASKKTSAHQSDDKENSMLEQTPLMATSKTMTEGKRVNFEDEVVEQSIVDSPMPAPLLKTPQPRNRVYSQSRAISTPQATGVDNITFHQGEYNISMVPPSPIANSCTLTPLRLNISIATQKDPVTPSFCRNETPEDIICMFSPDKPEPEPRPWNVRPHRSKTSTAAKRTNMTHDAANVDEQQTESTVTTRSKVNATPAESDRQQSKASKKRRSPRLSNHPKKK